MTGTPVSVCDVRATLGEGPVWIEDALWFVDIKQQKIHRFDPSGGSLFSWDAPRQVGWILPAADGGLVAGLQDGIYRFDSRTGDFALLAEVEADRPGNRLNDAATDPAGADLVRLDGRWRDGGRPAISICSTAARSATPASRRWRSPTARRSRPTAALSISPTRSAR